ncbi:hypothetical protein BKA69DRAFT_1105547 [Paraphysoderma sedebokerense]|nr:hypothetical protein BKA69DRAFT_1105547 [Paraphysoderma sedebokerense]
MAETIYDLFDEILTLIFMYLDHATLFNCLTVSKYFYENAVRALWHTIDFDALGTDFATTVRRIHRCVHYPSDRNYPLLVRKIRCYEAISTIANFRDCQSDLVDLCLKFKNLEYISIMPCFSAGSEEVFVDPPELSIELIHSFISLRRLKQLNISHVLNHTLLKSTLDELYDGAQCQALKSVTFNGLLFQDFDDVGYYNRLYEVFPNVESVRLERPLYAEERRNVGFAFLYVLQYSWWRVITEWPSVRKLIITDVDIGLHEANFSGRSILGSNIRSLELSHLRLRN